MPTIFLASIFVMLLTLSGIAAIAYLFPSKQPWLLPIEIWAFRGQWIVEKKDGISPTLQLP